MSVDTPWVMTWLGDHSLRVAALILTVAGVSLFARRASAHGRLFAWTLVLHMAVAMPLLALMLPEVKVPSLFADPVIVVPAAPEVAAVPLTLAGAPAAAPSWSWQSVLTLVYFAGAGMLLMRLLAGWWVTTRVVREARGVGDIDLPAGARVLESDSVHVPFACGVVRPALVLPAAWRSWDAVTLQAVLAHECSHIARRDLWALRLAVLYRAVTWVNPLSWWLRRKLETLAECASDDAVLAAGVEPTTYAEVLVRFFEAAQRAPGRASWQVAMARRGDAEARRRVGRVLSTRKGGHMALGMTGRMMVAIGVSVAAVPMIVLAASVPESVVIQPAPQTPVAVAPTPQQLKQMKVDIKIKPVKVKPVDAKVDVTVKPVEVKMDVKMKPVDVKIEMKPKLAIPPTLVQVKPLKVDMAKVKPVTALEIKLTQAQDPEPWRSTRRATDPDVVAPVLKKSTAPKYTPDAMRAKIQGSVEVEVIISEDGEVTLARVLTSLDNQLGLDHQAMNAAMQYTFEPATYQGNKIAVRARIQMEFRLH